MTQPSSLSPYRRIGLTLAIVLLLLGCQTATNLFATPTPQPTVTPRSTPTPRPSATSQPSATPEPTPIPATPAPNLLFDDDFSNPNSGWDRYSDSDGSTDYFNGQYRIQLLTDRWLFWANPGESFTDAIIEVEATMDGDTAAVDEEDDNNFGIICRHRNVDNFYVLVISSDGYYGIRKRYQGASELEFIGLDGMDRSNAIHQGNATNTLRAECIGSTLRLFVNGELLMEVVDSDIPSGDTGLMAGTFSAPNTTILFDNFTVLEP